MFGCTLGPEVRTISPILSVSCACSAPPLCVSDQPAKRRGCRIEAHSAVAAAEKRSNSSRLPRSLSRRLLLPPPIVGYHRRKLFDASSPKIDQYFSLRRCSKSSSPSSLKIVRYLSATPPCFLPSPPSSKIVRCVVAENRSILFATPLFEVVVAVVAENCSISFRYAAVFSPAAAVVENRSKRLSHLSCR